MRAYNSGKQVSFQGSCGWGSLSTKESFKRNAHWMDRMWLSLRIIFFFLTVDTHTSNNSDLLLVCKTPQGDSEVAVPACTLRMLTQGQSWAQHVWNLCHRQDASPEPPKEKSWEETERMGTKFQSIFHFAHLGKIIPALPQGYSISGRFYVSLGFYQM